MDTSDPEFTVIRISHLQATLSATKATHGRLACLSIHLLMLILFSLENDQMESRARHVATRIVSDHLHKVHLLTSDNYDLLRNILIDQLNWYKSLQLWHNVIFWAEAVCHLTESQAEKEME